MFNNNAAKVQPKYYFTTENCNYNIQKIRDPMWVPYVLLRSNYLLHFPVCRANLVQMKLGVFSRHITNIRPRWAMDDGERQASLRGSGHYHWLIAEHFPQVCLH